MPATWEQPLTTILALKVPSVFSRKTHMFLMAFRSLGNWTSSHVPLSANDLSSLFMANSHCSRSSDSIASLYDWGTVVAIKQDGSLRLRSGYASRSIGF